MKLKDKSDGVRVKIFVNLNGKTFLCKGRREFLELVDHEGSIKKAAEKMDMSYRRAWDMVKKANTAAGFPVIQVRRGGKDGGYACLTEKGKRLLEIVDRYFSEIYDLAERQTEKFMEEFTDRCDL